MLKALHKVRELIKSLYLSVALWVDKHNETQRSPTLPTAITRNATQASYEEGLRRIKAKVTEKGATKEEIEKFLDDNKDLIISLAENDETKKEIESLKKLFVYKNKDIKSSVDLERMIDKRIKDYKELQSHKLQRQKLRELRKQNGRPRNP